VLVNKQLFSCVTTVDSCIRYLSGDLKEIEQPLTGRQYYFLHNRLKKILRNTLSKRFVKRDTSIPKEVCEAILCDLDGVKRN